MDSQLSDLQSRLLEAFFEYEDRFFLTGGAALVGFYLGHRKTADLDLFTNLEVMDAGEEALRRAASTIGATVESVQTAPRFRRRLVATTHESVIVDLVVETAAPNSVVKRTFGKVIVDAPEEILANKLCTALARAEIRDLVDLAALEKAGYRLEDALLLACEKDRGFSAAQLSWVIEQIQISNDASIPGGGSVEQLREYLADLQLRLAREAYPSE